MIFAPLLVKFDVWDGAPWSEDVTLSKAFNDPGRNKTEITNKLTENRYCRKILTRKSPGNVVAKQRKNWERLSEVLFSHINKYVCALDISVFIDCEKEELLIVSSHRSSDVLVTVRRVTAAISLLGCLFTIFVSLLFRKFFYSFVQRFILYVSISALLTSIGYLMEGFHPSNGLCIFQGFWITFAEWSLLLWVSFITVDLCFRAFFGKSTKNREWVYVIIGISFPTLMAGLPFISNAYGPAGPWCWITRAHPHFRFGIWYGPLFLISILLIISNLTIFFRMRSEVEALGTFSADHTRRQEEIKEGIKLLKFYPFIYVLLSIVPCANRFLYIEFTMQYGLTPIIGSLFFTVYSHRYQRDVILDTCHYSYRVKMASSNARYDNVDNVDNVSDTLSSSSEISEDEIDLSSCEDYCEEIGGAVYAFVLFLDEDTRTKLRSWNEIKTALMALTMKRALIKEYSAEIISYGTNSSSSSSSSSSNGDKLSLSRRGSLNIVNKNHQLAAKAIRQRAYSVSGAMLADLICPLGMSVHIAMRHGSSGSDIITSEVEEESDLEPESEPEIDKH
ncbi:Cyclic AMP receptor-like protein A [Nymphon striatum]|nr:Cyclic AMP receptor-like protein A [Nymphon striatum]